MPEQIQKILDRIVEWWKKFNTKQRALLISITAVVVLALVILGVVISQPEYTTLITCEGEKEAANVKELLDSDSSIQYRIKDVYTFDVAKEDEATATFLLGENDIYSSVWDITNVTSGGFSHTEADKTKLYQKYLEEKMSYDLENLDYVDSASVELTLPKDDGTILARDEEAHVAVTLEFNKSIDAEQAAGIARFCATAVGNESTEFVTIIDKETCNVIYCGTDSNSVMGMMSSQYSDTQRRSSLISDSLVQALKETKIFSEVQPVINLVVDYDQTESTSHEFSYPDGMSSGVLDSSSEYESESYGGSGNVPGTDANGDDTTYTTPDDDYSYNTISDVDREYSNNEYITQIISQGGKIKYDESSISVVANRYVIYDEVKMREAGLLDEMTFEEFEEQNNEPVKVEVDPEYITLIAKATGFPESNISFMCFEQPQFVYEDTTTRSWTDIFQIALVVLIFALLGYVVFRSTRTQKQVEEEPELSVESLLESTSELSEQLEDIGYSEKSEIRILIEKFVDENPDAVALLLRNWLNEDWE